MLTWTVSPVPSRVRETNFAIRKSFLAYSLLNPHGNAGVATDERNFLLSPHLDVGQATYRIARVSELALLWQIYSSRRFWPICLQVPHVNQRTAHRAIAELIVLGFGHTISVDAVMARDHGFASTGLTGGSDLSSPWRRDIQSAV
jgi:hypothetical protein